MPLFCGHLYFGLNHTLWSFKSLWLPLCAPWVLLELGSRRQTRGYRDRKNGNVASALRNDSTRSDHTTRIYIYIYIYSYICMHIIDTRHTHIVQKWITWSWYHAITLLYVHNLFDEYEAWILLITSQSRSYLDAYKEMSTPMLGYIFMCTSRPFWINGMVFMNRFFLFCSSIFIWRTTTHKMKL